MALYAYDEERELIYANGAVHGKTYWCIQCALPVRKRRGKDGYYHFCHALKSPQCKLYYKKEDHFLTQIQIQKLIPEAKIEKPFIQIDRVADVCIEEKKIVLEIQCSPITESEVCARMKDYRSLGYEVIWLLDDRRYNRRKAKPEEKRLRTYLAYYLTIKRGFSSEIYDQFEVFLDDRRVKKGKKHPIDLKRIFVNPKLPLDPQTTPKQILALDTRNYCFKDRLFMNYKYPTSYLEYWRDSEKKLSKRPNPWIQWIKKNLIEPYDKMLGKILENFKGR